MPQHQCDHPTTNLIFSWKWVAKRQSSSNPPVYHMSGVQGIGFVLVNKCHTQGAALEYQEVLQPFLLLLNSVTDLLSNGSRGNLLGFHQRPSTHSHSVRGQAWPQPTALHAGIIAFLIKLPNQGTGLGRLPQLSCWQDYHVPPWVISECIHHWTDWLKKRTWQIPDQTTCMGVKF